jgi:hypothetical protein
VTVPLGIVQYDAFDFAGVFGNQFILIAVVERLANLQIDRRRSEPGVAPLFAATAQQGDSRLPSIHLSDESGKRQLFVAG